MPFPQIPAVGRARCRFPVDGPLPARIAAPCVRFCGRWRWYCRLCGVRFLRALRLPREGRQSLPLFPSVAGAPVAAWRRDEDDDFSPTHRCLPPSRLRRSAPPQSMPDGPRSVPPLSRRCVRGRWATAASISSSSSELRLRQAYERGQDRWRCSRPRSIVWWRTSPRCATTGRPGVVRRLRPDTPGRGARQTGLNADDDRRALRHHPSPRPDSSSPSGAVRKGADELAAPATRIPLPPTAPPCSARGRAGRRPSCCWCSVSSTVDRPVPSRGEPSARWRRVGRRPAAAASTSCHARSRTLRRRRGLRSRSPAAAAVPLSSGRRRTLRRAPSRPPQRPRRPHLRQPAASAQTPDGILLPRAAVSRR